MLNSGVMYPPMELLTAQSYNLQFGTNVIGHYLLSKLLIPLMERTAVTFVTYADLTAQPLCAAVYDWRAEP